MQGLFKKVTSGVYDPIPAKYSQDLREFIKSLLQVNSKSRPNCDQILQFPYIQQRLGTMQIIPMQTKQNKQELLATIKLPRNINLLQGQLPRSNYEEQKQEEIPKPSVEPKIQKQVNQNQSFESGKNQNKIVSSVGQYGGYNQGSSPQQAKMLSRDVPKRADYQGYGNQYQIPQIPSPSQNQVRLSGGYQIPPTLQVNNPISNDKNNLKNYGNRVMNRNQPSDFLKEIANQNARQQQVRLSRQNSIPQKEQQPKIRNLTPVNKKPDCAAPIGLPRGPDSVAPIGLPRGPAQNIGIAYQTPLVRDTRQQSKQQQLYNASPENPLNYKANIQSQQGYQLHRINDISGNEVKIPVVPRRAPLPVYQQAPSTNFINSNIKSKQISTSIAQEQSANYYQKLVQQNSQWIDQASNDKSK